MVIPFPKERALHYFTSGERGLLVARDEKGKEYTFSSQNSSPLIDLLKEALAQGVIPTSYIESNGGGGYKEALNQLLEVEYIYFDGDIAVVNKEHSLHSVPGRGAEKLESVTTRLKRHFPVTLANPAVHRLDYDTSGLMTLALNSSSLSTLGGQFAKREVHRRYVALLEGSLAEDEGVVVLAFRYDPPNKPRQAYDPVLGKWGETHWKKLGEEKFQGRVVTRVELLPLSGRTHQLRLHASHPKGIGLPIVGDALYGDGQEARRMMLHATDLSFKHPVSGEYMEFCSPEMF